MSNQVAYPPVVAPYKPTDEAVRREWMGERSKDQSVWPERQKKVKPVFGKKRS